MILAEPAQGRGRRPERATLSGRGQLTVELVSGQSAATCVEAHSPLKILVPRPRGQSVWSYLSNFGGGLLPGDELDVAVSVGENAACFVGAQSSTKIFRSGPKGAAANRFSADIGSGALLVYAPDVAQGFANSRYIQRQSIDLADETAGLVYLDWYSSGRSARGERWAFNEYTSRTEICVAGKKTFLDSVRLNSSNELISLPDRMGRANCIATVVLLGSQLKYHAGVLLGQLSQASLSKRADALIVGSAIPGGAVFRVVGISVEAAAHEIFPRLSFISELLGDNPFQRKF
jgi:urease accessory protein